ncbi:hypothetical protein [Microbacterium maritypicum]
MVGVSTAQVASLLNSAFGKQNITHEKVWHLVGTGVFTDVSPTRSVRIDLNEVLAMTAATRVVTPDQWPHQPLFRVSLTKLRPNPIPDPESRNGVLLRTHAGADYANAHGLSPLMRERAWTGVWEVSDATIEQAIEKRAILFGTTKGYIHPDYVRTIVGAHRDKNVRRVWWETEPVPATVRAFVGTGLWMDVQAGRESHWA